MKNIVSSFSYNFLCSLLCIVALFISPSLLHNAQAGTIEVKWQDPDSYTDIRHGNSHKTKFRKNLFTQLEQHLEKLTEKSPKQLTLKIKVTNLNLAGDVRYNFSMSQDIRMVQHMYWPSIEFEYSLMNDEQVVKSETVKLKDMAFMDRGGRSRLNHDSYYYEKRMLTEWIAKDLQVIIADYQQQK
jgi:hypothetical protein